MLRPFPPPTASTWGFMVPEFYYTKPSLASREEQLIAPGLSFWTLTQNDSNSSIYRILTQILVSHILNFDVTVPASLDNICAAFLTGCLSSSDAKIKTNSIRKSKWWWWWSTFLLSTENRKEAVGSEQWEDGGQTDCVWFCCLGISCEVCTKLGTNYSLREAMVS